MTRQSAMDYEEHEKRAWSVDFSCTEPSLLIPGSDDCKLGQNLEHKTRSKCSQHQYESKHLFCQVGSVDHQIHYCDLRNICQPLRVFSRHQKAVCYVNFLPNNEPASASTDRTLRLWDINDKQLLRTFRGHINQKIFCRAYSKQ